MKGQSHRKISFSEDTDVDLMGYMSMRDEDPVTARDAWAEFYKRHVEYLYSVCYRAYSHMLVGDAGVADIVSETFFRAYRNATLYNAAGIKDADRIRRRTRAWLGRIAQRLVLDALRGAQRMPTYQFKADEWDSIPEESDLPSRDETLVWQVEDAIKQLTEREQTVIRVTFEWYQPGLPHQRLPNDVVAELSETLKTTPENLRQIRRRALAKIRRILEQPAMPSGVNESD